jgi:hypothetical protein
MLMENVSITKQRNWDYEIGELEFKGVKREGKYEKYEGGKKKVQDIITMIRVVIFEIYLL